MLREEVFEPIVVRSHGCVVSVYEGVQVHMGLFLQPTVSLGQDKSRQL